jgi:hypothetical protein
MALAVGPCLDPGRCRCGPLYWMDAGRSTVSAGRSTVSSGAELGAPPGLNAPEPGGGFTVPHGAMEPAPAIDSGSGRVRFHAVLWHRFGAACGRVKDGLDSMTTLSTFVKKRLEAERELAKILFQMTKGSWSWGGARTDVLGTVKETGRVLEAWEVMMRKTTDTCRSLARALCSSPLSGHQR